MTILTAFLGFAGSTYQIDTGSVASNVNVSNSSFNIIVGISILPWYINTLLILIPAAILILLLVVMFIPTINAGS